jgi:3-hydroxybutyryl-CoA dehydratase
MEADNPSTSRGLYFEQFQVGQQILTPGRTITETDIVNFAGLSGDYNQIHTDAVYSAGTPFGKRVAHGLLVLSIVSGLAVCTGIMDETVIAFREVKAWKFAKPVFIGDTLHALIEVVEKKALPRLSAGSVEISIKVINQCDDVVMKGAWVVLVSLQPE